MAQAPDADRDAHGHLEIPHRARVALDLGRDDPKPTDVTWLSGDRLLLSDKDGNTWLVDPRARRAQPLADPDTGKGWFDGRDLVFHLRDGSFASASIGP